MKNINNGKDIPLGFGMALAQNLDAMNNFTNMNEAQQQSIIQKTGNVKSKNEMQAFVQQIADGHMQV